MPCSAYTLSLATIAAVVSVALLAIAFSTDNWSRITIDRLKLEPLATRGDGLLQGELDTNILYFSRTKGLFRICFEDKKVPKGVETYRSPVETICTNIDYYIPDDKGATKNFSEYAMARLHMGRAMIALFIVSFFFDFIAFWTGVVGCWRRGAGNITSTAILMLLACLFSAGGMGLWHGVEFYENEKLVGEREFLRPKVLKDASHVAYDWSYMIAWIGVGFALISSILFSCAAICLRREREKEEAVNMQYLMPVYPQKQQYAYGYAYPGPYYHGSQYGPYNY